MSSNPPPGLQAVDPQELDKRPDAEIAASLREYSPVTSEKNVWAIWHSGFDGMHDWCQRNVIAWVRKLGKSWTVRVVDRTPESKNEIYKFVDSSYFPDAFNENTINGRSVGQQASNMMRVALLYHYGGIYMDVSIMLFRHLDRICWSMLENPTCPANVAVFELSYRKESGQAINCFIAARAKDPFIERWMLSYKELWRGRSNMLGVHKHPMLEPLGLVSTPDPAWADAFDAELFTDYSAHMLCFERLSMLQEPGPNGFDGVAYFREHIIMFSAFQEIFHKQDVVGEQGLFDIFTRLRDTADSVDSAQMQARETITAMLAESSMMKLPEGYWFPGLPTPTATLIRQDKGSDCRPGTWGEYLRHGSVHLEQLRLRERCLEPVVVPPRDPKTILRSPVLIS